MRLLRFRRISVCSFVLVPLLTIFPGALASISAQTFLGSIVGSVTDSTGAVVADAVVKLTEIETGIQRDTRSNAEGLYTFADVKPGRYRVEVNVAGFKSVTSSAITVTTQKIARFDVKLEVGDIGQKIEVTALAPTINTENAQLSDVRTREDLLTLPVNTRSTTDFRYITSSNYEGGYLAGQRGSFGYYSIDGASGMAPAWGAFSGPTLLMSLEALQEVKLVTSSPSAEYGDVATVYLGTRSGTNQLHGSAFYLHSNNAFNARNFFAAEKPTGPILHETGGSLAGPIRIPKLYDGRNRSFFMFSYERRQQPGTFSATANVPTLKMRNGDFSELLGAQKILDPETGKEFDGNIIPQDRLSPVALKMQDRAFMPLPNFGPSDNFLANYRDVRAQRNSSNLYTLRLDHNFRPSDTLSVRFTQRRDNEDRFDADLPAFFHYQYRYGRNAYISETHLFSPTIVNEARFSASRDTSPLRGLHNGTDLVNSWGIKGLNLSGKENLTGVPQVSWVNFSPYRELNSYEWDHGTFELLDNITFAKNRHVIKAGFLWRDYTVNAVSSDSWPDFGTYSFDGFATGFDYADFLLGLPHQTGRYEQSPPRHNRYGYLAGYIQDDWRVNQRLTLNFGLRYEYGIPPVDTNNMRFAFDPATGNLVVPNQKVLDTLVNPLFPKSIPIVTAQAAGFPERSLLRGDKSNWGPRFGFAFRPTQKSVIRGGYGIYYTPLTSVLLDPFAGGPFQSTENFTNSINDDGVPLFQLPRPFTDRGSVPTQSVGAVNINTRTPYTHQWNLTFERELPGSIVARFNWRGHKVTQLLYSGDRNKPLPSADPANTEFFRYPQFFSVTLYENGGTQIGNLFETEVERKFAHDLTFQFGWTVAKILTDVPGGDVAGGIENPYDRRRERADDDGVTRHRAVAYAIYELPFGSGKRYGGNLPAVLRQTLGNWQISSILVLQSGHFLTPSFCCDDVSNTRTFGGRPDRLGDAKVSDQTIDHWFDPTAFAVPQPGTFGNSARSVITGPGLVNFDFGLFKLFKLSEDARIRFDMTATNLFNHTNFGNPNMNISSASVGRISSVNGDGLGGGARRIKLGLRIDF